MILIPFLFTVSCQHINRSCTLHPKIPYLFRRDLRLSLFADRRSTCHTKNHVWQRRIASNATPRPTALGAARERIAHARDRICRYGCPKASYNLSIGFRFGNIANHPQTGKIMGRFSTFFGRRAHFFRGAQNCFVVSRESGPPFPVGDW